VEDAISEYFSCEPQTEHFTDPSRYVSWYYEGERLKYELIIDKKAKTVSVSGDFVMPWSSASLYEVCVLFDRVALETEPQFYGDRKQLVFRKDYEGNESFISLMIMKWDNGELSVWPGVHDAYKSSIEHWDD